MYVNINRPFCLTLIEIRKTNFKEFSGGAASLFNLRQQHSELSLLRAAGLAGLFVRGIQLTEQMALFTYKGFISYQINRGTDSGILAKNNKNYSKQIKI